MNRYDERMQELRGEIIRASKGAQPIKLSDESLQSIERTIGHSLSTDYREFLRDYGCYGLYAFFRCGRSLGGEWGSIRAFYGLTPKDLLYPDSSYPLYDTTLDLLYNYEGFKNLKPVELLPIGDDPGGSQICLAIAGDHIGSVYFWDRVEAWSTTDYFGIYFVANSFDEFMRLLMNEEEFE
ncbi:MAG: SMI1/KNR4 family protein, partial [Armatimonadota bacterium]|nr:SMI1/KNR4 family protein [Armatimonadota bacterium]